MPQAPPRPASVRKRGHKPTVTGDLAGRFPHSAINAAGVVICADTTAGVVLRAVLDITPEIKASATAVERSEALDAALRAVDFLYIGRLQAGELIQRLGQITFQPIEFM